MTTIQVQPIAIPFPAAERIALRIRLGPCRLRITPGDGPEWVSGTYDDPTGALPLDVGITSDTATIAQRFEPLRFDRGALPVLDLAISRTRPFALAIDAGASDDRFDLGGLPLTKLDVRAGAGRYDVDFSIPNPAEMTRLELSAGAGALNAWNLANANFAELHVGTGVTAATLEFGGALRRDASARIEAGLTSVEVRVPGTTAARVVSRGFAAGQQMSGTFLRDGEAFVTPAAKTGGRPLLSIEVQMALGSLLLKGT